VAQIFGLLFPSRPVMYLFWQKMGWATFWAIFSQTDLVTLARCHGKQTQKCKRDAANVVPREICLMSFATVAPILFLFFRIIFTFVYT
jgi:hypothetical protein